MREHEILEQILHEQREELRFLATIQRILLRLLAVLTPHATTAKLGVFMATTATLTFVDDSGATQPPPAGDGSGLVVTFASDNPAVTLGTATASGDTATAPITGTEAFNLSGSVANTSGATLFDDDGVTEFVQPASIAIPASTPPAQATTAVLSVS